MVLAVREKRERGEEKINPTFFPQSMEFRRSEFVGPRPKVHRLDEGYAWVPKNERFHQRSKRGDFEKSKFSGLGGVLETFVGFTTLQDVGILSTFVYFHPKGCFGYISTFRCHLALFTALRGCLAWVKMTLIVVPQPVCGWFCVLICGCV